jgi:hypothetical protein
MTPATSATASSRNGSPTTSTLMSSTSIGCPKTSPIWLSDGRANPLSSAAVPPNPRYLPDAYAISPTLRCEASMGGTIKTGGMAVAIRRDVARNQE